MFNQKTVAEGIKIMRMNIKTPLLCDITLIIDIRTLITGTKLEKFRVCLDRLSEVNHSLGSHGELAHLAYW